MENLEKDEFLKAYRNIASHLKRKFTRKPIMIAEAVEAYGNFSSLNFTFHFLFSHIGLKFFYR